MCAVATYQGAAYADVDLDNGPRDDALIRHIEARNPGLTNIRLIGVTWTEFVNTRVRPHMRRYNVTYVADGTLAAT